MISEPLGDKVKFYDRNRGYCDRKSPHHGMEAYWVRLLERVKRESETISSKEEALEKRYLPVESVEKDNQQTHPTTCLSYK